MLASQRASPNSPQWFNTGLNWAYGIEGPAQGHYFVNPETEDLERWSTEFLQKKLTLVLDKYTREDRGLIQCFQNKRGGSEQNHKKIVVLLTINNMGKISSLKMKEVKQRNSALERCLKKELLKMTLVSFEGEPIEIVYRFNIQ